MSLYLRSLTLVLAGLAGPLGAFAQSDPAVPATSPSQSSVPSPGTAPSHARPSSAQSEAGEPRAATSADDPVASGGGAPPGTAPAAGPPAAGTAAHPSARAAGAAGGKTAAADRLELGTATVTGDREQPKVMYIVPWKKSDIGDLSGKPMNSLLDEALAPVDRDEFKRQVMYYQVVKADASQNGASKAPPTQGEK
ncbi:MAG: hypothetical protein ABSG30_06520 [Steroidobacteraceae bacterium]|jgi:hypothetical protein